MTSFPATKPCPRCAFGAGRNARACARCGHFFLDSAPLSIRTWVRDHARHVRQLHPSWSRDELRSHLEDHMLHDQGLLAELERAEQADPASRLRPAPELLERVRTWVEGCWHVFSGDPPADQVRKLRAAIEDALDDEFRPAQVLGFTPFGGANASRP